MAEREGPYYVVTATVQVKLLVDSEGRIQRAALDMEAGYEIAAIAQTDLPVIHDGAAGGPNDAHYSIIAEGPLAREHRIATLVEEAEWPNIEAGLL